MRRGLTRRALGDQSDVGIGTSLFLIAVGAILYFAVSADVSGLSIQTVGLILMIVGIIGLAVSLFLISSWRRDDRPTTRDRDYY
jgi:Domain of unknown function (DUF6458)